MLLLLGHFIFIRHIFFDRNFPVSIIFSYIGIGIGISICDNNNAIYLYFFICNSSLKYNKL